MNRDSGGCAAVLSPSPSACLRGGEGEVLVDGDKGGYINVSFFLCVSLSFLSLSLALSFSF